MRKTEIWVLLADAARARLVRHPEHAGNMEQAPVETIFEVSAEHRPLRDIMADAPGRSFASIGARRSAMEYHADPVRDETRRFALSLLSDLEARRGAGDFDQLVICAPPRMLGLLRELMPTGLASVVRAQVAKDFTKLPALKLREQLRRLIAVPG